MRFYLLFILFPTLVACSGVHSAKINDGPYVLMQEPQWQALWVCDGVEQRTRFAAVSQSQQIENCSQQAQLYAEKVQRPQLEYSNVARVAVISDVHGQAGLLRGLLIAQGIIDKLGNWQFADGHLVVVGDVFDRGPEVTESLWLLYQLDFQAREAGGQLHFLLGNHEVMVLNGRRKYLHDKYLKVEDILARSMPQLYARNTVLGQWLQSRNVLVKINDMLFTHGGLHPDLVTASTTLADINQAFTQNLIEGEQARQGFARYLHKTDGPVWYRGYFREPQASEAQIDSLLKHFDVRHIVVGHTTQNAVTGFYHNKVIAVDAGIKRGKSGEMLLVEQQQLYRGLLDGGRLAL